MASPRVLRRTGRRLPPTPSPLSGRRPESLLGQTNGVSRSAGPVCCRCNVRGKCMSCICVKQGRVCTSCLPSRTGGCHNPAVATCPPPPPLSRFPTSSPLPPRPLPRRLSSFHQVKRSLRHLDKRSLLPRPLLSSLHQVKRSPRHLDKRSLLPRCLLGI